MAAAERLGAVADQLDTERFVGRARQRELVGDALAGRSHLRIFHVHGPGGVGKSALLRAIEREARADGHPIVHLDGRLVTPNPDALAAAIGGADVDGSLLIIDEADELIPLRFELRHLLQTSMRSSTVVVLAGRTAPGREWFDQGLDQVSTEVLVRPLDSTEARELLRRYDVVEPTGVEQLLTWASGYPLALTVGANLLGTPPEPPRATAAWARRRPAAASTT
ncbi:ATP-binding protein [Aquihabitans daechungensis]|uniref:ATP-binding protein n=1 Tax=Aquihabitans daechungensis TaxID=1052257 RepID=UPI003B9FD39C